MKKVIALLMVALLVVCATAFATGTEEGAAVSAKPDKITLFLQAAGQAFPPNFSFTENDYAKQVWKWANIEVEDLNVPVYADTLTKFNLMMASGKIPDVVHRADITAVRGYGMQGAFMDLTDIIKKSPKISSKYNAQQLMAVTEENGKIYVLPSLPTEDGWHLGVRFDLLADAGYTDAPSTIDGWLEAMRKVKAKHPDSLPYTSRGLDQYHQFMFTPFGCGSNFGWEYRWDAFANVFENPLYKDALTFGRKLIVDGLMDPEFVTTKQADYELKRLKNKVLVNPQNTGTILNWVGRFGADGQSNVRWMMAPWPVVNDSRIDPRSVTTAPSIIGGHCIAISAQTKVKDAAVRFIEVLLSDELKDLYVYGREGIEYTVANGRRMIDPAKSAETVWRSFFGFMFSYSPMFRLQHLRDLNFATLKIDEQVRESYRSDFIRRFDAIYAKEYNKVGYSPAFFMATASTDVTNRTNEAIAAQKALVLKFLMGEITMAQFEAQAAESVKKYQSVTDDNNRRLGPARAKLGLK